MTTAAKRRETPRIGSADGTWSWDPGGATLQEFRLRVGFVHLPPAFYGWRHHHDLIKISRSPELSRWSLGTSYDRPIPRRLVEQGGVPRELLGMKKRAVSVTIGIDKNSYLDSETLSSARRCGVTWRSMCARRPAWA
jgi:hypothetical protein